MNDSFITRFVDTPMRFVQHLGLAVTTYAASMRWAFMGRIRKGETLRQLQRIGVESIPMVMILGTIGGGVLSLQLCNTLGESGGDAYVGGLVAIAVVREIGPIFTALALTARNGTAIASELAHMNLTNQVDALEVLQIDPLRYLVLPRILACLIAMPLLSVIACLVAILSGMIVARIVIGMNYSYYINSIYVNLPPEDLWQMIIKSLAFGAILGMVSAKFGMHTKGGSREVGLAAMKTAVWVSITTLIADLGLTWIFKTLF